jgi:hypothetical protein
MGREPPRQHNEEKSNQARQTQAAALGFVLGLAHPCAGLLVIYGWPVTERTAD